MSDQLPEQSRPWPLYLSIAAVVILLALGFYFAGTGGTGGTDPEENRNNVVDLRDPCEIRLEGLLAAVDPLRLGVSSNPAERAADLTRWRGECAKTDEQILTQTSVFEEYLSAEEQERVAAEAYSSRDVEHLRTSVLLRQLADRLIAGREDRVSQAVALFNFACRHVIDFRGEPAPAMSLYDVLTLGRGTPQHRAWLFVELLRQVRIDGVILQPRPLEGDTTQRYGWLVGVLIEGDEKTDVYVFDALIGLPIPGPDEAEAQTPFVQQPATLAQLRKQDELLRRLDLPEQPYLMTAERLEDVRVGIVGTSSLWAERMAALEYRTDLRGTLFFDGLGPNRLGLGEGNEDRSLLARVSGAGENANAWSKADLFVWPFPAEQLEERSKSESTEGIMAALPAILEGPTLSQLNWERSLRQGRNQQLVGSFKNAISVYRDIRAAPTMSGQFQPSFENDATVDFATYWSAQCQYEMGAFDSVRNTAATYPPPFITQWQPYWVDGIVRLFAFAAAEMGAWEEAVFALSRPVIMHSHGTAYLLSRWARLGGIRMESPAEGGGLPMPAEQPDSAAPTQPESTETTDDSPPEPAGNPPPESDDKPEQETEPGNSEIEPSVDESEAADA